MMTRLLLVLLLTSTNALAQGAPPAAPASAAPASAAPASAAPASAATTSIAPSPAAAADPNAPAPAPKETPRQTLVELTPFLSFDGLDLPGPLGGGIGEEFAVRGNWYAGGMLGYSHLKRLTSDIKAGASYANSARDPIAVRLDAYAALVRARYFAAPLANTWFLGAGVAAVTGKATFAAADDRIGEKFTGAFVTGEYGYRWLFGNGFTFSANGRAHSDAAAQQSFTGAKTATSDEARRKLHKGRGDLATGVLPSFSFSLGLAF